MMPVQIVPIAAMRNAWTSMIEDNEDAEYATNSTSRMERFIGLLRLIFTPTNALILSPISPITTITSECSFKIPGDKAHKEEYGLVRGIDKSITLLDPSPNVPLFDILSVKWDRQEKHKHGHFLRSRKVLYIKTAEAHVMFNSWQTRLTNHLTEAPHMMYEQIHRGVIYCLLSQAALQVVRDLSARFEPQEDQFVEDRTTSLDAYDIHIMGSDHRNISAPLNEKEAQALVTLSNYGFTSTHLRRTKVFVTERTLNAIYIAANYDETEIDLTASHDIIHPHLDFM